MPKSNSKPTFNAIKTNALDSVQLFQIGFSFHKSGQLDKALSIYQQILSVHHNHFDALHLSGVIEIQNKNPSAGLALIDQALTINNQNAGAHFNKGMVHLQLSQIEVAITSFDKAIKIEPSYVQAYFNRGNALAQLLKLEEAIENYSQAISMVPNYAEAYCNLANAFTQLEKHDEAIDNFQKALKIAPNFTDALFNISNPLLHLGRLNEALVYLNKANFLAPNDHLILSNRGLVLMQLGMTDDAVENFNRAIELCPSYADTYSNCGLALMDLGRVREALQYYERAINIDSKYYKALSNKGKALSKLGKYKDAIEQFNLALEINPEYAPTHWNKANALLTMGDFEQGWELYEWRWKTKELNLHMPSFKKPLWLGAETLSGKTILLHAEQGLGDSIQFCRYAKLVSDLGAKVLLQTPKPLIDLFGNLKGVDLLVEEGNELPYFDYHCPLLSLPLALKTALSTIPKSTPYLFSSPEKKQLWINRINKQTGKLIGLAWSGNKNQGNDRNRSIKLSELLPYLPTGFTYISMQKELRDHDKEVLINSSIQHFGEDLKDFTDTAALCDLMDMVVSVDTSIAHLAGAIGKPVSILLPFDPGWRWLLNRDDSPWYPSAKLYRQNDDALWEPVFKRLANDINCHITS